MTSTVRAGVVVAVCVSSGGVPKLRVDEVMLDEDGLIGDGHNHEKHRRTDRAISIQDVELVEEIATEGYPVGPGIMGENLTVQGLDVQGTAPGDRLAFEGGPLLEVASIRKPCYVLDAIHPDLKEVVVGRCGVLCRVIRTGVLRPGQRVELRVGDAEAGERREGDAR